MKSKTIRWLVILILVSIPVLVITATGSAISGASFTIFNAHTDDSSIDICKNTGTDCNLYVDKENVWLNGGPNANIFDTDGVYFFAVLEPVDLRCRLSWLNHAFQNGRLWCSSCHVHQRFHNSRQ